jgi:hypothetical protein
MEAVSHHRRLTERRRRHYREVSDLKIIFLATKLLNP